VAAALSGLGLAAAAVALVLMQGALEQARREVEQLRAQASAQQTRIRELRGEVLALTSRVEEVARASSAAHARNAQLRRVARLEESREPEVSPWWQLPSAEVGAVRPGTTTSLALQQLDWLESQTAALNESIAVLGALLRDGRSTAAGGMPTRWPVRGEVTSGFGAREAIDRGGREFHPGVDIRAPVGTPVLAAGSGEVALVATLSGYGRTVVIDHGAGVSTLYAHLSAVHVPEGASVRRGEVIGTVGRSGRTTGPHLHYEVRVGTEPMDPTCYLGRIAESNPPMSLTSGGSPL